jgi:hypothetical protein
MSIEQIINALDVKVRPPSSALIFLLNEGPTYFQFTDPYSNCLKEIDHISGVEYVIHEALLHLRINQNITNGEYHRPLPCGHTAMVNIDNRRICSIDITLSNSSVYNQNS